MADPKKDPYAAGPNNRLIVIAGAFIFAGIAWFCWEAFLRELTPEEKKELQEQQEEARRKARGEKSGGHGH